MVDTTSESMLKLIKLEHYHGSTPQSPKNNWKVMLDGRYIGDLHDCNGIGGQIGEFTETKLFDYVCELAVIDLKKQTKG